MTTQTGLTPLLLMDACVLIDFVKSDQTLFRLFSRHVGLLYVISPVVNEVGDVDGAQELEKLGLIILEPELDDVSAAANSLGSISFQDTLCLLTAKRKGFTCVTNDIRLRKECEKLSVPIRWGLQLLLDLHKKGGITPEEALEIAQKIHEKNPKHISPKVLARFIDTLKDSALQK